MHRQGSRQWTLISPEGIGRLDYISGQIRDQRHHLKRTPCINKTRTHNQPSENPPV